MTSPNDAPEKPKRRVRYSGKNPKKFSEKYKELNPERYAQDIEKIKSRGATPVGTHRPICVDEIMQILAPKAGESALDATLGYGGHTSVLLSKLLPGGRLIGLDQDPIERTKTEARLRATGIPEESLIIGAVNFRDAKKTLADLKIFKVDMILADLGISSMQIDDPNRGFSYKINAPLDLRMNPTQGISAAELLTQKTASQVALILHENSDEMRADVIAKALVTKKPKTNLQMVEVIREVISGFSKKVQAEEGDAPIRKAFQALRIAVNDEFNVLDQFLKDIPEMLNPNGRVAILSFHSGEDRRVKKSFQFFKRSGVYKEVAEDFIRPSPEEQRANSRSTSAKLRWAKN
ncbi:MAG: 16S rRNA (cytosine(1402)-N(4))-methyltransferase RsmH [Pseudobdellovibrio sp.]